VASQIVVVTNTIDPHSDEMINILTQEKQNVIRLNTDEIPLNALMTFLHSGSSNSWSGQVLIQTSGRTIDLEDIRSIWWRRPKHYSFPQHLSKQEQEFAKGETMHALEGVLCSLNCYWMSLPASLRRANPKAEQLRRAAQLGMRIPDTLISNDKTKVMEFYEAHQGSVIYKVMSDPMLAAEHAETQTDKFKRGIQTILLDEKHLTVLDSVRWTPCLFQEYIPKKFEYRVTVIGNEIFTAEIDSQVLEATQVDWRMAPQLLPHKIVKLPDEINEACLKLTHGYGLNYGAIDLILTPDGQYVFLEINANGQFMWVEELLPDLKMKSALAACLIRGEN
jgi:glutathione synthase/RimK-type ligase-like ATP-grasp enzyme